MNICFLNFSWEKKWEYADYAYCSKRKFVNDMSTV